MKRQKLTRHVIENVNEPRDYDVCIPYFLEAERTGIKTSLTKAYHEAILKQTDAAPLTAACESERVLKPASAS